MFKKTKNESQMWGKNAQTLGRKEVQARQKSCWRHSVKTDMLWLRKGPYKLSGYLVHELGGGVTSTPQMGKT